jgi:methyl-accepting chemotaxis protein
MADFNSINNTEKAQISELSDDLHELAAQLSGIKPILRMITDMSSTSGEVGNSLEAIGALSEHINDRICDIATQLNRIGEGDEHKAAIEAIRQQVAASAQH